MAALRCLLASLLFTAAASAQYSDAFTKISDANVSDSLRRISHVPLSLYTFKYDTIKNRTQLGVLGQHAQTYFPESVEILPSRHVPGEKGQPPIVLKNFPVVDKSVIYMHAVAAVQELIRKAGELEQQVETMRNEDVRQREWFEQLSRKTHIQPDSQLLEQQVLAEAELRKAQLETELVNVRAEEERLAIKAEIEEQRALKQFEEQLARARMQEQFSLEQNRTEQKLALERMLLEKRDKLRQESQEALQLVANQHQLQLEEIKRQTEIERIREEARVRAQAERDNEDIELRKLSAKAEEDKKKMIEMVNVMAAQISNFVRLFVEEPSRMWALVAAMVALYGGAYLVKEMAALVRQLLLQLVSRPRLVRESSVARGILPVWLSSTGKPVPTAKIKEVFHDVILTESDKNRVIELALATSNARSNGAPYRHVMLHGLPGTGKTMVAKRLAASSGMDYAVISGGDVAPLGKNAVTEIHNLFRWAKRSRKGLLLFIDEAEAFLGSRTRQKASEHIKNALNALLFNTGTESMHFMLVIATNRPEDLDDAIIDRIDESVHFSLPGKHERQLIFRHYCNNLVVPALQRMRKKGQYQGQPASTGLFVDQQDVMDSIACKLEGYSGREIAKFVIAIQSTVLTHRLDSLSATQLHQLADASVAEHHRKQSILCSKLQK